MKHVKHLFWAAVVVADVYFGRGLPQIVRAWHRETRFDQHAAMGVYGTLAVLSLIVIVSVARGVSGKAAKPAPRPASGYPFRGGL